jgi:hypothetical protein
VVRKSIDPVIVDYSTFPVSAKAAKIYEYEIPKQFKSIFMVRDVNSYRNWSVEFLIEIGDQGTPTILEITPRGLSSQSEIWIDGVGKYLFKEEHNSVTASQLEIIQRHLRRFLTQSIEIATQVYTPKGNKNNYSWTISGKNRQISTDKLRELNKSVINSSAKRRLSDEFLMKISREHNLELKKAEKTGSRFRGNEHLSLKYMVSVKTIESWLVKSKKVSAKRQEVKKGKGNAKRKKK